MKLIEKRCLNCNIILELKSKKSTNSKYCTDNCKLKYKLKTPGNAVYKNNEKLKEKINFYLNSDNLSNDYKYEICKIIYNNLIVTNIQNKNELIFERIRKLNIIEGNVLEECNFEKLYNYLINNDKDFIPKCPICNNNRNFSGFKSGYYSKTCRNRKCKNSLISKGRFGEDNPYHSSKITKEKRSEMGEKVSIKIKERIKNGTFTPNITNSWCHSRINVKITKDNKEIIIPVRSTWEAVFLLNNTNCLYEKLRIPYVFENKVKNYIVDFIDLENKIVYEIKPEALMEKEINKIKYKALQEWSKNNGYTLKIIDQNYLKENYSINLIKGQPDFDKLQRILKKYEN